MPRRPGARGHWPRTLTVRIMLAEVVAIIALALLLAWVLTSTLRHSIAQVETHALYDQARAIAAGLRGDGAGRRVAWASPVAQVPGYANPYDGRAFVVVDAHGHALLGSRFAAAVPWTALPRRTRLAHAHDATFYMASLPVRIDRRRHWVLVSQDESSPGVVFDDMMRNLWRRMLFVLVPALLVLPLVNALLVRRIVMRVRVVSDQAAAIGSTSLDERLDVVGMPGEIVPLIDATNTLLGRLEASFNRQAEFAANVAHELRTPLATLLVGIDAVDDPALRDALAAQIGRLSHVVSQLRDLATLENGAARAADRIDLVALARDGVERVAGAIVAGGQHVGFVADDAPVWIIGERVLIDLALANLLTNAMRHTPAGTTITVTVTDHPAATLAVADDGPGVTRATGADPLRRFWRADHRRSDSAGIGLAIVARVMDSVGGRFDLAGPAGGGVVATLRFASPAPTAMG